MARTKIIVPCYNEAARFESWKYERFNNKAHEITFLFVNDGSSDASLSILESLRDSDPSRFSLLSLSKNEGKAEAVRRGFTVAFEDTLDYVGFWDADLATPLDAIPSFLELAESHRDIEIVIGSRVKLLGRRIERCYLRHYLGRIFATTVSLVLSLGVYDTQCGAKLFRVSPLLKELFAEPFHSRWIFDVEIIARLVQARRGKKLPQPEEIIYELPLTEWRDIKGSKVKPYDFLRAIIELAGIYMRYVRRIEYG